MESTKTINVFTLNSPFPIYSVDVKNYGDGKHRLPISAFRCPVCRQRFGAPSILAQHLHTHSPALGPRAGISLSKKLFLPCSWNRQNGVSTPCRRRFSSSIYLGHHLLSHTKEFRQLKERAFKRWRAILGRRQLSLRWMIPLQRGKVYECSRCIRKFCRFSSYRQHILQETGRNGVETLLIRRMDRIKALFSSYLTGFKREEAVKTMQNFVELEDIVSFEQSNSSGSAAAANFTNANIQNGNISGVVFFCHVCKKSFSKKGHLTRHMVSHGPEPKPYTCNFCPKRYASKYSLEMHLLRQHGNAKPFSCSACEKRFALKTELDNHHDRIHSEGYTGKKYTCPNCDDLVFHRRFDLDFHIESKHPELSHACPQCQKTFATKYKLVRHEKTHLAEKTYHCQVPACGKEFSTTIGCQKHLQSHEQQATTKPLSCSLCQKKFAYQQTLKFHRVSFHSPSAESKAFACESCEVRFSTKERLKNHCETHGSGGEEGRVFHCSYCPRTFPRKYNHMRHEYSHTDGRKKPRDGRPPRPIFRDTALHNSSTITTEQQQEHPCSFSGCLETFSHAQQLRYHITSNHKHQNNPNHWEQPISTEGDSSSSKINIEFDEDESVEVKHEVILEEYEDPEVETSCSSLTHDSFIGPELASPLNQFENQRSQKRKPRKKYYFCPNCDLKCGTEGELSRHIKAFHLNLYESFTCPHCPKTFPHKYGLSRHERGHHHLKH